MSMSIVPWQDQMSMVAFDYAYVNQTNSSVVVSPSGVSDHSSR
jgi:hypothetical protein